MSDYLCAACGQTHDNPFDLCVEFTEMLDELPEAQQSPIDEDTALSGWKLFLLDVARRSDDAADITFGTLLLRGGYMAWPYRQMMAGVHDGPDSVAAAWGSNMFRTTTAQVHSDEYHKSPGLDCKCGINAWNQLPDLPKILRWSANNWPVTSPIVLAEVELWGDVIEHEKGYRAEYAEMVRRPRLLMPTIKDPEEGGAKIAAELEKRYELEFIVEVFPWPYTIGDQTPYIQEGDHGNRKANTTPANPAPGTAPPLGGAPGTGTAKPLPRPGTGTGAGTGKAVTANGRLFDLMMQQLLQVRAQHMTTPSPAAGPGGSMQAVRELRFLRRERRRRIQLRAAVTLGCGAVAYFVGVIIHGSWM